MVLGVFSFAVGILLSFLVVHVKGQDQRDRDRERKIYRLTFPADLDAVSVQSWLQSISGTLQAKPGSLLAPPNIAFEVWASSRGIVHRLHAPWTHADFIIGQLRSLVPGILVTPEEDYLAHDWMAIVEMKESNPSRPLRMPKADVLAASLLASMQALNGDEQVLVQWVVTPAVPEQPPTASSGTEKTRSWPNIARADSDEINERRAKLSEPNVLGVLRIAARANTHDRSAHLIYRVQAALASTRSPYNRFKKRLSLSQAALLSRVKAAAGLLVYPCQLAISELTPLIAWPIGQPHVAGLPQGLSRHLPATEAIPREGRVIAISNFPGAERPLAISAIDSCQHMEVIGPNGCGKTTMLSNLIAQDMQAGRGVILIESKGDLFQSALDLVPRERIHDVVVLDVSDTTYPPGFNILQGNPQVVASDIMRLFEHLYPQDLRGVRVRQGMYHALLTLMTSQSAKVPLTFADLGPLCVPRADQVAFADNIIRGIAAYEELAIFWQEMENLKRDQRAQFFGPIMDRIWQLNSRPSIRNIIGQSRSTIDIEDVIRNKKVLLVYLGRATEGKETASLVGSLLLNRIWSAVQAGASDPYDPTFLYLDEFQDFINLPISAQDWFAQARSRGLAVTVAHQHLSQLNRELQDAVLNNARSKAIFQTSADDARTFAREFGRSVTENDFMNLRKYNVIARLASGDGVSAPITGVTKPPPPRTGWANEVRRLSRMHYARPVSDVEAEIKGRRQQVNKTTSSRPNLGPRKRR